MDAKMYRMNVKMLKPKNLQEGIKRNMTIDDFCDKYECSPEELKTQIGYLYSHNSGKAKEFISQIEANSKKARKAVERDTQEEATDSTCLAESDIADEASVEPLPNTESVASEQVAELEKLKNSERIRSRKVMDLEVQHEEQSSQHRGCLNQLRELKKELLQIESDYDAKFAECEAVIKSNNEFVGKMNEISLKLRDERAALDEDRQAIAEKERLIIFVYSEGEIYLNDARIDEGILLDEELFNELLVKPECEELKIKEIKTLTKMLIFAKSSTLLVEVTCENEDLEIAYLELS